MSQVGTLLFSDGLRKLLGFGFATLLTAGVNFIAVPILIRHAGADVWAGIAVAQSVAVFASVIVSFGWGVFGAAWIAGMARTARGTYFLRSMSARFWLFLVALPIALMIVRVTSGGNMLGNMLACIAGMIPALGAAWFFVGESRPGLLVLCDTVPRLAGTVAGAASVVLGASVAVFSACQLVGSLIGLLASVVCIVRRYSTERAFWLPRAALRGLREQLGGVVTAGTASLYVSLPLVWVSATVPGMAPIYALSDKLFKAAVSVQATVTQVAQGYVPSGGRSELRARVRRTLSASAAVSTFMGMTLALGLRPVCRILSGGELLPSFFVAIGFGIALFAIGLSGVVGTACLPAFGATRVTAASTVLGALVGVPMIAVLTSVYGIGGTAWAVALSEIAVSIYQLVHLRRKLESV